MVVKYVLAGGPGSGKTKGIKYLQKSLLEKGYKVYVIQETATELIESGLDRRSPEFPYYNFSLMLYKELLFEKMATDKSEDAVILCDRGRMDPKAYRGDAVFNQILERFNIGSEKEVLDSYDGVLFLQTTADGLEKKYLINDIRTESTEQAVKLQERLMEVWQPHSNFVFINNSENVNEKLETLEQAILDFINDKIKRRLTAKELIEYSEGLKISDKDMFAVVEKVLLDKKIIDRTGSFEH